MNRYAFATIEELLAAQASGDISHQELIQFFLKRLETYNPELGVALQIFSPEEVTAQSTMSGPLAGIPGVIKNNIAIKDQLLTCGSKILENYRATYDATAIDRLKQAGACFLGGANLDEFAMGSSTETSAFFKTRNPWDHERVPGGSSGGAAAAVAAGLVPWALGTDTGGSVRQPAALCGIVGLKPTYGLVSRYGIVAYGSSLDQIGIFSRSVKDNARILSVIAGHDIKDSSTRMVEQKDYTADLTENLPAGLRIGVVDNAVNAQGMDPEVRAAIDQAITTFTSLGASIHHISLPTMDYSAATYFIISRAEAASNLARFDGIRYGKRAESAKNLKEVYGATRHDGFGAEVKSRIMVGNYVLSASHAGDYYDNAQKVRRMIRREFLDALRDVDVLLLPTSPAPAFKIGAFDTDKLQMDLQDYFTCPMNLAGIPAISIPCGFSSGNLPIGMQLAGKDLSEGLLYQVAHAYEQATDWHTRHPEKYQ